MLWNNRKALFLLTVILGVLAFCPVTASAVAPQAYTVPWVATNPTTPHDAWLNKIITFKGASDSNGVNIQYSWDYGDGTVTPFAQVTDQYSIEGQHAYTTGVPEGTVFAANLTVKNTVTNEFTVKPYFVKIRAKTLEVEINVAIDEGLWYLHKTLNRGYTCGGLPCGYWTAGFAANSSASNVAANVNAFEVNGHLENDPRGAENPYADDVARGLRTIFWNLTNTGIADLTTPIGVIHADQNPNGQALYAGNWPYELGPMLDAIIASGAPNTLVGVTGKSYVSGRPYKDVARDIVDMFLYCQYPGANIGGGWYYSCQGYGDNSISQWAAIGILAAARADASWGFTIPQLTYDWNRSWLAYSFQPTTGIFGYQSSSTAWGPYAVTPSGMVQMVMDGMGRTSADYSGTCNTSGTTVTLVSGTPFNTPPTAHGSLIAVNGVGYLTINSITDANHLTLTSGVGTVNNQLCWWGPRWKTAETFMRDNFGNNPSSGPYYAPRAYLYGLFSFTKAMLLHNPPIQMLHSETAGVADLDWYSAQAANGDPTDGVARTLIDYQCQIGASSCYTGGYGLYNGAWFGPSYTSQHYAYTTAWAIIMLNRTLFSAGAPVAVATASPNPAVTGAIVTLDGSGSFHQDPSKTIVSWKWDGITVPFSATGPSVTTSFAALGNYSVRLTVTDNVGITAQTIVTVQVAIPPVPPTANAGGPYSFCPNRTPWFLDGTKSAVARIAGEPGAPDNFITKYVWDLNGGQNFSSPVGAQPDVTAFFTAKGAGTYLVQLQVTDNSAASYPHAPNPADLTATASGQVTIHANTDPACAGCIGNLSALAKNKLVQLTWPLVAGAHHYNVYRSLVSGGPYTQVGTAISTQTVYMDQTVTNGTTYYYVVRPAALNGSETCQSNEVSAKPKALR